MKPALAIHLGLAMLAGILPAQDHTATTRRFFDAPDVAAKCALLAEAGRAGARSAPLTPWLAELLDDPRPAIRGAAAEALRVLAPHADAALPVLEAHLARDRDPDLQRIARTLLECILSKRRRDADVWRQELAARGADAVPELLEALARDRTALAELHDPLVRLLPGLDRTSARRVLTELRSRRAREAVEALAATLGDDRCPTELHGELLELLGELAPVDDPRFDAVFLDALRGDDARSRSNAARALAQRLRLRPETGVDRWLAAWQATRDPNARQHLLQCWWNVPDVPGRIAVAVAPELAADRDGYQLADLVSRAGTEVGVEAFRTMLGSGPGSRSRRVAARSLARHGARAAPAAAALCQAAVDPDPEVALEAVRALARIPPAVAGGESARIDEALRSAMQHPLAEVRRVALTAAIAYREPDPATALDVVDLLDDPDPTVAETARVLAPLAGESLRSALLPTPAGPRAARLCATLLDRLAEQAEVRGRLIRTALSSDDPDVREATLAVLSRPAAPLPDGDPLALLRAAGLAEARSPYVAARAAQLAARLGPRAGELIAELAALARSVEPFTRDAALAAIDALGPDRDALVADALRDTHGAQRAALLDLVRTPDDARWERITADCAHSDPVVRAAARAAVDRLLAAGAAPPPQLVDLETITAWRTRLEAARRDPQAAAEELLQVATEAPEPICIEALALLGSQVFQPDLQRRAAQVALGLLRTGNDAQRAGAFGLLLQARLLDPGDWSAALCDPDARTRLRAGLLMRLRSGRPPSATLHTHLIEDPLPGVRRALVGALRQLDDTAALPFADRLLTDPDPLVRMQAWQWFAARERCPSDLPAAVAVALRDPDRAGPHAVLDIASRHPAGASTLLDALRSGSAPWRGAALALLHRLGVAARPAFEALRADVLSANGGTAAGAAAAIAAMDWPAGSAERASLDDLVDALVNGPAERSAALAWLVVARGRADCATLDVLRAVPGDASPAAREAVARALLRVGEDPETLRADLRRLLVTASERPLALAELAATATRPVAVDALAEVLREHLTNAATSERLPQWYVAVTDLAARASPGVRTRLVEAVLDHLAAAPAAHTDHRWTPLLIATGTALPELLAPRLSDRTTRQRLGPGVAALFVVDPDAFARSYADATADPDLRAWMLAAVQAQAASHPDALLQLLAPELGSAHAQLRHSAWAVLTHCGAAGGRLLMEQLTAAEERGADVLADETVQALVALGPDAGAAVPLLVAAFDQERIDADRFAHLLAALGPRGVTMLEAIRPAGVDVIPLLIAAAKRTTHPPTQIAALRALVRLEAADPAVAELCNRTIATADPEVRTWAGLLACRVVATEPAALPAVHTALEHLDPRQRILALEALTESEAAQLAVGTLAERIDDPAPSVRAAACRALGRLGTAARPARGVLRTLLVDPADAVRAAAAEALGRIRE